MQIIFFSRDALGPQNNKHHVLPWAQSSVR
jgi:hypothetical protein